MWMSIQSEMKPKNRVVKVKFVETGENPTNNDRKKSVTSGFDKTVFEFLQNYEPSSSSRKPLWCRVCKFQGGTLNEFNEHMVSSTHQEASQIERPYFWLFLTKYSSQGFLTSAKDGELPHDQVI